eukprot:CAMPEP_0201489848 /NCGR_PEP_ID=MMETSP0151_2-20130828/23942_1 /ASSEMBLY_ACC=CAM_ASM_000257 /TAXON_ID=200890 /ORGANISM="Paramoeba atlantica, Strain 621/1 / CCAP 1560/9" /LENGTH=217 /DNA_ID=CAMNT_0047875567 /DNA_START=454 /DNA_END=1107 /DNA_ORIENTATION=-
MTALLEVVTEAPTLASINKKAGGAMKVFSKSVLTNFLQAQNPSSSSFARAKKKFLETCAGCCVFTYLFGITDRHNDNILLKKNGALVHIDYGHFLGNVKTRLGMSRERSPFVFTPQMLDVLGGTDSPAYESFVRLCVRGYLSAKRHFRLFRELFRLMISAQLPELTSYDQLQYLFQSFDPSLTEAQAEEKMKDMIQLSVKTWSRQLDDALHIIAHPF